MASGSLYKCLRCQLQVGGDVEDAVSEELTALWKSNVPPTSEKESRTEYTATSYALKAIESQIRELSASMKSLKRTRARMAEKKRLYRYILHPIRRLPPEILTEIFRIRTFGDIDLNDTEYPGSLDTRKAPWMLGQVCRAWRSVAASTPSLWAKINVSWWRDTISASCALSLEALLSIQLKRSQDQHISLSLETSDDRLQQKFLSMLCSRASQWRTARLKSSIDSLNCLRDFRGAFRSLKLLEIRFIPVSDVWTSDGISPLCAFEDCPSLTELKLRGKSPILLQRGARIPWRQIIRYEARSGNRWLEEPGSHSQILPKLERVEVCVLDSISNNETATLQLLPSPLKLCFLHTLVINIADSPGMDSLLSWLVLPTLCVLRLVTGFSHPEKLVEFLDRSQCSLEELAITLECYKEHSDEFPHNLTCLLEASALHNLRTLQIRVRFGSDGSREIWEMVIETLRLGREGRAQAMPRLRRLVLNGEGFLNHTVTMGNEEVFLAMVSSRCFTTPPVSGRGGAFPLEELTLWNFGEEGTTPLEQFGMEHLMEVSSAGGLTCSWHWGRLDWRQVD
ncbi:hypothetical protein AAF712_009283 [Marasmius tenuissimus]|uniref:F-box domain-containing protein n=1 Tax=Marasmius tenuissimus TaxID=585030 RepID=A0ABR2ZR46_9AGAR|nr:hypothetical protein PM082_014327 [Marasmius tenuissimus]